MESNANPNTRRLFAAIHVKPGTNFLGHYDTLRNGLQQEQIRWADEGNIHLTLKFIGDTPEPKVSDIVKALEKAAADSGSFVMVMRSAGVFGSSHNPKVIWFGVDENKGLSALAERITNNLAEIGVEDDRQNFVPHITLGRIKFLRNKKKLNDNVAAMDKKFIQPMEVEEFFLFESRLTKEGPRYSIVETFRLQPGPEEKPGGQGLWQKIKKMLGLG